MITQRKWSLKASHDKHSFHLRPKAQHSGFTLVELLVALALSAIIAVAAIAALTVARQGFNAVDASSQLRDNGRFASELIQRLGVQSGYQDLVYAGANRGSEFAVAGGATNPIPNITGVDNALVKLSKVPDLSTAYIKRTSATVTERGCTSATDTACANGSDVLILRYQSSAMSDGATASDGSMINCAGFASPLAPISKDDQIVSILHVAQSSNGEPSLMCTYQDSGGSWRTQPIVQGVESFQVLYGIDGFSNSGTSKINQAFDGTQDTVPDKYVAAREIVKTSTPSAPSAAELTSPDTYNNWRRVRSIRIGMVLRGPPNSAVDKSATVIQKLCPLGVNPDIPTDCIDQGDLSATSMGSEFPRGTAVANDGRLRQTLTFTVFLRNVQTQ
ncbi:MAG: PilW family protein [Burkholderiales bacterium]|nr:PilW family protein [Burkholderiales bacterium]